MEVESETCAWEQSWTKTTLGKHSLTENPKIENKQTNKQTNGHSEGDKDGEREKDLLYHVGEYRQQ